MSGRGKLNPHDPTAERTADQSTQTAGGLHQGLDDVRPGSAAEVARESDVEDVLNRNDKDLYDTPRRYDEEEAPAVEGSTPKNKT
jgi:hypothetical protein